MFSNFGSFYAKDRLFRRLRKLIFKTREVTLTFMSVRYIIINKIFVVWYSREYDIIAVIEKEISILRNRIVFVTYMECVRKNLIRL